MDDTVNETAYQTSVNIGGHVFSGFLYDQGPEQSFNAKGDNPFDQQHDLNLRSVLLHTRDGASATMPPLSLTASQEPFFIPHHSFPLASFRPDLTYILIQLEPSSRTFVQRRLRELVVVLVEKLVLYILLYIC